MTRAPMAAAWERVLTASSSHTSAHTRTDEPRSITEHFPNVDLSDWHTWAGRWTANEMCTYLDGVEIGCVETFDTTAQPMHIVFTVQYLGACVGCPPRPATLEMQVDWVRVWQLG